MDVPDEQRFVPPPMRDEEGDWEVYHFTRAEHEDPDGLRDDYGAYMPTPLEVRQRIGTMRWLAVLGFDDHFMCSVMQHECPTIGLVRRFVSRYGPEETRRRLKPWLENTEYE